MNWIANLGTTVTCLIKCFWALSLLFWNVGFSLMEILWLQVVRFWIYIWRCLYGSLLINILFLNLVYLHFFAFQVQGSVSCFATSFSESKCRLYSSCIYCSSLLLVCKEAQGTTLLALSITWVQGISNELH